MTDTPNMPPAMTMARLNELIAAYGAVPARWPDDERAAALALLDGSAEARAALDAADWLDDALDLARPPAPSAALRDAVLEIGPGKTARPPLPLRWLATPLFRPLAMAAAGALGIALGLVWTPGGGGAPPVAPLDTLDITLVSGGSPMIEFAHLTEDGQ